MAAMEVVFGATLTAVEAFALPARLVRSPALVAACRARAEQQQSVWPATAGLRWQWGECWPAITAPWTITKVWRRQYFVELVDSPGPLRMWQQRIAMSPYDSFWAFAADQGGCQAPIRRVFRALARELGADRVLYLPDARGSEPEVGDLGGTGFDEALARLAAWGPPVSAIGALQYGKAIRSGYHYADRALRHPDGTPVTEAEIWPGRSWHSWDGVVTYSDGTLVPPEELARPDLRDGFAYYIDDFRDLE